MSAEEATTTSEKKHCTACKKSGFTLDYNVYDDVKNTLTHRFVNKKGEFVDELCSRGSAAPPAASMSTNKEVGA